VAYDSALAERVRQALADRPERVAEADLVEKKMFGGIAFLVRGHMCCGIVGGDLMLRVGPDAYEKTLALAHVRPMDFTGRPLRGMVYVDAAGLKGSRALGGWLERGLDFVDTLPAKKAKGSNAAARKEATKRVTKKAAGKKRSTNAPPFAGFPKTTFGFLRGVEANGDKAWFEAHRADYEAGYVEPAVAFVEALGPRLRRLSKSVQFEARIGGSIFRIQRDMRFVREGSPSVSPYKTHLDLIFWDGEKGKRGFDASSFFFRLAPGALTLGVGIHRFDKYQLMAYRDALQDARKGRAFDALVDEISGAGAYEVGGAKRKRLPPGADPDHARAGWLLQAGLTGTLETKPPAEVGEPGFVEWCADHYAALAPLHRWLLRVTSAS